MKEERVGQMFLGGIGLLGVLIVGGLVWAIMAGPSPDNGSGGQIETDLRFRDDNDPARGPGESKVVVRMFGDFQCPACKAAEPGVKHAMSKFGDKVRFVWNDFPLSNIHKNARPAAVAARCAEEQGKFWEYHDVLYDKQSSWSELSAPTASFVEYAKQLSLDEGSFASCVASQTVLRKIQDDESEGMSNRVNSTPTVFIGQKRFVGSLSPEAWDKELTAALGS